MITKKKIQNELGNTFVRGIQLIFILSLTSYAIEFIIMERYVDLFGDAKNFYSEAGRQSEIGSLFVYSLIAWNSLIFLASRFVTNVFSDSPDKEDSN